MSLILNGTDGLSDVDGSASTPAIRGTDTNTGIFFPAADTIAFAEGGAEVMRLDSSGNLGLGTTSTTTAKATIAASSGSSDVGLTGNALYLNLATPATTGNYIRFAGAVTSDLYYGRAVNSDAFVWGKVNGAESMRIDSSGNLCVGATSTPGVQGIGIKVASNPGNPMVFYNSSSVLAGYISVNNATTSYITSSDYRLKENISPMTGALTKVAALKPVTYKWKADGSNGQGFIAHELAEVVPECVSGEKDQTFEDGSIKPQGIDTSFLVATLTAAIQEQQAMIETLKTRIEALEQA